MTATLNPTTDHRWYTVHHPAEKAYAAMCAVLLVGMAGIAVPGVPSYHFGEAIIVIALGLYFIGGVLEQDVLTAAGGVAGMFIGNYVVQTASVHRSYSHWTVAGQATAMLAGLLLAGRALRARAGR